jgi:hypothetical protein
MNLPEVYAQAAQTSGFPCYTGEADNAAALRAASLLAHAIKSTG